MTSIMKLFFLKSLVLFGAFHLLLATPSSNAETKLKPLEKIHFLIPAGPGGGGDGTARGIGEALLKSELIQCLRYS